MDTPLSSFIAATGTGAAASCDIWGDGDASWSPAGQYAHQDVISAHQWDSSVLISAVSSTPWLWRQLGLVILLALSMLVRVTCMELCYFYSVIAC